MQVIEDNYTELKQLKDQYELAVWLGQHGCRSPDLWEYRIEIVRKVVEIMEGGDE
jgi:hypothetical protein